MSLLPQGGRKRIYNGMLLSHKEKGSLQMNHYAKWNKPEKYNYCMVLLICGIEKLKKLGQIHQNRVEWWLLVAGGWGK